MTADGIGDGASRGALSIQPVEVPKPAEVFADLLRQKIFAGEFRVGETLPPERVLVEQSQLSRASVRDALSILKQQGLIVTRAGRGGGSVVSSPTADDLITSMNVFVQSKGWGPDSQVLLEMREIIQPWCAALAATRASADNLAEIDACHQAMCDVIDDVPAYVEASQAWHFAVADASHSPLVSAVVRVHSETTREATGHGRYDTLKARKATIAFHAEITEHIRARRPREAFASMDQHVAGGRHLLDRLAEEAAKA